MLVMTGINSIMREEEPDEEAVRAELVSLYGKDDVFNTEEATQKFEFVGFAAPFVVARRKSDNVLGSLAFTHMPRFYYDFREDKR
jgi:hypothetical protein